MFTSAKLFVDDTTIPVLDSGRGRTKTGRLWVIARDDRPRCGPDPLAVLCLYCPDRRAERLAEHLRRFEGVLLVDCYTGFEQPDDIALTACWAHAHGEFHEIERTNGSLIADEAVRRTANLHLIARKIQDCSLDERQRVRTEQTRPLIDDLKVWTERELHAVPPRGGLADAIRYFRTRCPALSRFLDDGRIEIDSSTFEFAIQPIALGCKNTCSPDPMAG